MYKSFIQIKDNGFKFYLKCELKILKIYVFIASVFIINIYYLPSFMAIRYISSPKQTDQLVISIRKIIERGKIG